MAYLVLFSRLYTALAARRRLVLLATAAMFAVFVLLFFKIRIGENILAMIPDTPGGPAYDFELMQQAPFIRKVLIDLQDNEARGPDFLLQAGQTLAAALDPDLFPRVVSGPADAMTGAGNARGPLDFLGFFVRNLPNLLDEADLEDIGRRIEPAAAREALARARSQLSGAEGLVLKPLILSDPLDFRSLALRKLQHLNLIPRIRLHNGRFLSQDGKNTLLIAETSVPMTDFGGAQRLAANFEQAKSRLPAGIAASMLCGHLYTLANARAIKQDLAVLLTVSTVAMLILFFLFLRPRMAINIFLLPFFAVCVGGVAVALVYAPVSGVTLGFGAVLLGMGSDYALYVYLPLQRGAAPRAAILAQVARPLFFSCATTLAGFAVLLFSELPGQRQLALFSLVGLGAAFLLSLVVLPHLEDASPLAPSPLATRLATLLDQLGRACVRRRRLVIAVWLLVLAAALVPATRVRVNAELRALGIAPAALRATEARLRATWGDMRGQALIFSIGSDQQTALGINDRVFSYLRTHFPKALAVSLAPLLPANATQEQNRQRWDIFWDKNRPGLKTALHDAGRDLGFTKDAFHAFGQSLDNITPNITTDDIRKLGLADILDALMPPASGNSARVLTLAPDSPDILQAFTHSPTEPDPFVTAADVQNVNAVRPVAQSRFAAELSRALSRDFVRFVSATALLVLVLLALMFKNAKKVGIAFAPALSGLIVLAGIMGLCGLELTIYHILASVLIISSGVDYGIFMVQRLAENYEHDTELAVLVAGLSTLVGFGTLILAQHPALHSIGLTVLVGMAVAMAAALLLVPALYGPKDLT